jgi:hypothetical protein
MSEGSQRMIALYKQKCPKAKLSSKSNSPTKWNKKTRGKQWKGSLSFLTIFTFAVPE